MIMIPRLDAHGAVIGSVYYNPECDHPAADCEPDPDGNCSYACCHGYRCRLCGSRFVVEPRCNQGAM